ncbi:MAG: LPXTG cell wall anchor domain-containing protein, partial [Clostridiales bacterium]|nr:LPXTG cell wall anchor domain-containing protein [Candidatus Blautia equi]
VESSGSVTEDGILLVEDDKTSIQVSKVETGAGEELPGAHIEIIDSEGTIVEEWISGTEPHPIVGLKTGEEYTLRETVAPEGYTIATDTTFTINPDGTVESSGSVTQDGILLVEDDKTSIQVSKRETGAGEELPGAHIEIIDSEGTVVEEWISGTEPHPIKGLKTEEEYILRETVAPEGYSIATDTTFTINPDGTVVSSGSVTEDGILLIEDDKANLGKIIVTKKLKAFDEEIDPDEFIDLYAKDATFYVGLFTDEEATVPYGLPKAIHIVNACAGTVEFANLKNGTYYVYETTADGIAIMPDEEVKDDNGEYTCFFEDEGSNVVEITPANAATDDIVELTNLFLEWPDGFDFRAELNVTKQIRVNGQAADADESFYVGVFSEKDLDEADVWTNIVDDMTTFNNVQLLDNNGTIHLEVPFEGGLGDTITYWVFETDEEGHKVSGATGFGYVVSGEGTVALNPTAPANITITNSRTEIEETPTPTPSSPAPKTGDNSRAELYLLLMAAAMLAMGGSVYGKKRRQK